jgi:protocatechuate 3,4-dioxygenase beta subunit
MSAAGAPAAGAPAMSAAGAPAAGSGGMGAAGAGGMMTPLDSLACVVTPAMTDGPFFVDQQLERSNLVMGETEDSIVKAVPLHLVIGVFTANGMMCKPVSGVHVDIWHADALGIYSDVAPGAIQSVDTRGKKFLRGWQATDESGTVAFDTIWPGWYMSRTIHIHFKLRMLGSGSRMMSFTSQMFFDESINSMVLAKAPYSAHTGRSVLNDGDHIYNGTATNAQKPPAGQTPPGKLIMPTVTPMGAGYTAVLKIGLMG